MKLTLRLYVASLVLWFVLHLLFQDGIWWLALISIFSPYLFTPSIVLIPLACVKSSRLAVKAALLSALVFCWEYGYLLHLGTIKSDEKGREPITVMSFNIWGYSQSVQTAAAITALETPDVVALQELAPAMAQVLNEELSGLYPYQLLAPDEEANGRGILSRYPLADLGASISPSLGQFAQVVQVQVKDRTLTLYNVHLSPTNLFYDLETKNSLADGVRLSFETRMWQATLLANDMARRKEPIIVMGDMNTTEQSEAYDILTQSLQDAHRTVGKGFGHTFPAYRGSFRGIPIFSRLVRVDMILYSASFTGVTSRVSRKYGESDHLPVSATLNW